VEAAGVELEAFGGRERSGRPLPKSWAQSKDRRACKLVEAAGVEPASENVTGQETTCLFAFMPQAFSVAA